MISKVINKLLESKTTIATAESCTGGLVAKTITDFSGVSEIFCEGYVTYSNAAKIKNLGVNPDTLEQYSAVSRQTAEEMAKGVKLRANADLGVSTTGIAGPGGGTDEKPVGLVYIGVSFKDKTQVEELRLSGTREEIRQKTVENLFELILNVL